MIHRGLKEDIEASLLPYFKTALVCSSIGDATNEVFVRSLAKQRPKDTFQCRQEYSLIWVTIVIFKDPQRVGNEVAMTIGGFDAKI